MAFFGLDERMLMAGIAMSIDVRVCRLLEFGGLIRVQNVERAGMALWLRWGGHRSPVFCHGEGLCFSSSFMCIGDGLTSFCWEDLWHTKSHLASWHTWRPWPRRPHAASASLICCVTRVPQWSPWSPRLEVDSWKLTWRSWAPCKVFFWLAVLNWHWTADRLERCNITRNASCLFCKSAPETMAHILPRWLPLLLAGLSLPLQTASLRWAAVGSRLWPASQRTDARALFPWSCSPPGSLRLHLCKHTACNATLLGQIRGEAKLWVFAGASCLRLCLPADWDVHWFLLYLLAWVFLVFPVLFLLAGGLLRPVKTLPFQYIKTQALCFLENKKNYFRLIFNFPIKRYNTLYLLKCIHPLCGKFS
jgi:hypothetical protein